jgi:hypothetical protein
MTDRNTLADNDIKDFDKPSRYVLNNHKAGQLGTIPLDLCTDCAKKFDEIDNEESGKSDLKQKLISGEDRRGRRLKYEQ